MIQDKILCTTGMEPSSEKPMELMVYMTYSTYIYIYSTYQIPSGQKKTLKKNTNWKISTCVK